MICGFTTMLSLFVALNRFTKVVITPHSPRACATSCDVPYSPSQAPKKRAKVISVFCCAATGPASSIASAATVNNSRAGSFRCIDMACSLVFMVLGSDYRAAPGDGADDVPLEEQIQDQHGQPGKHGLCHEEADALGLGEVGLH